MWDFLVKGGPLMGIILVCSVIAFGVFIERLIALHKARINTEKFVEDISGLIKRNKIMEALDKCNTTPGPVARLMKMGILKHDRTREEIREAINDAASHEVALLEKNISILATIAHIAPLLGLLGTVVGMIKSFQVIEGKAAGMIPVNPGDLAGGIWEALVATAAGLCVAIPTYVAYNCLVNKVDGFVLEMEKSAIELVNILSLKRDVK